MAERSSRKGKLRWSFGPAQLPRVTASGPTFTLTEDQRVRLVRFLDAAEPGSVYDVVEQTGSNLLAEITSGPSPEDAA